MAWIPKCIATISKVRCVSNSTCKTIDMGTACEAPSLLTITLPDIMPHALSELTDWNATCVAGNSKVHCVSTFNCKTIEHGYSVLSHIAVNPIDA
jgi:hypothetical protein